MSSGFVASCVCCRSSCTQFQNTCSNPGLVAYEKSSVGQWRWHTAQASSGFKLSICDLGQVTSPLWACFLISTMRVFIIADLSRGQPIRPLWKDFINQSCPKNVIDSFPGQNEYRKQWGNNIERLKSCCSVTQWFPYQEFILRINEKRVTMI